MTNSDDIEDFWLRNTPTETAAKVAKKAAKIADAATEAAKVYTDSDKLTAGEAGIGGSNGEHAHDNQYETYQHQTPEELATEAKPDLNTPAAASENAAEAEQDTAAAQNKAIETAEHEINEIPAAKSATHSLEHDTAEPSQATDFIEGSPSSDTVNIPSENTAEQRDYRSNSEPTSHFAPANTPSTEKEKDSKPSIISAHTDPLVTAGDMDAQDAENNGKTAEERKQAEQDTADIRRALNAARNNEQKEIVMQSQGRFTGERNKQQLNEYAERVTHNKTEQDVAGNHVTDSDIAPCAAQTALQTSDTQTTTTAIFTTNTPLKLSPEALNNAVTAAAALLPYVESVQDLGPTPASDNLLTPSTPLVASGKSVSATI